MGACTVRGVDIETTLGFQLQEEPGVLSGAVSIPNEVEIPAMRGAIFIGPYRVPVREFILRGFLTGASMATVRSNLKKLKALVGDDAVLVTVADWSGVEITAQCVRMNNVNQTPQQVTIQVDVEMVFRAANPYWRDTSDTVGGFTSTPTGMAQGTAPSEPILECVGPATTPVLKGYDYTSTEIWSATFATLAAGEKYRINTAPGVMTLEKYNGSVWSNSDASLTAGTFPKVLPSNGLAYQSSLWPLLSGSTGTWTATYRKQWR